MKEPPTSLILVFVWEKHPCLWQGQHWLSFTLSIWLGRGGQTALAGGSFHIQVFVWYGQCSTHVSAHLWVSIYRLQGGDILGLGFFYLFLAYPVLLLQARACFLSSTGKNRNWNCCCMTRTKTCVMIWSWTVLHVQHLATMPSAPILSRYSC